MADVVRYASQHISQKNLGNQMRDIDFLKFGYMEDDRVDISNQGHECVKIIN
jgi:hypothetical protein